jgi:hypothetical protein
MFAIATLSGITALFEVGISFYTKQAERSVFETDGYAAQLRRAVQATATAAPDRSRGWSASIRITS